MDLPCGRVAACLSDGRRNRSRALHFSRCRDRAANRPGDSRASLSRLRKYFAMIEEALRDPISVGQLKINGEFMMKELGIEPGPRMGWILHALLEEVLDDPSKNTRENLEIRVKNLGELDIKELEKLADKARETKNEFESGMEEEMGRILRAQKRGPKNRVRPEFGIQLELL